MKIQVLIQKAQQLERRVLSEGYEATERDVAEARELVSQYIDELERLERTVTVREGTDIEVVADQILQRWYPHG